MDYKKAILSRISRRSYTSELPTIDQVMILRDIVERTNLREGLNIQLMIDENQGFQGIKGGYGTFSGVRNYIALVGPAGDPLIEEKLGYYGEELVLTCEMLGLGTCWVGGTFDKKKCRCTVEKGQIFRCAIVFGRVKPKETNKEKIIRKSMHKLVKSKKIEDLFYSEEEPPNWFIEGIRMVSKAPSTMNKQPVKFYYSGGNVNARVKEPNPLNMYDLGIAKFHFQVGAGKGHWEFGNGGLFFREEEF